MTGQEIEENTLVSRWVNEYMKEKEKREQLEKEYKLLNEKYEQALNDYDELLQSHPDCSNCENELMLKLSDGWSKANPDSEHKEPPEHCSKAKLCERGANPRQ